MKICAELGINHQGVYNTLIDLTDMSFEAGADIVKLQIRTPELCVPKSEWDKPKVCPWDGKTRTYIEYRRGMELTDEKLDAFDAYVASVYGRRRWSASVWDIPSLERLITFDVPWIKIPSAMLTNLDLIDACLQTGIPLIISTGMSTYDEVFRAIIQIPKDYQLTILHCNASYPAKDEEANLKTLGTLRTMVVNRWNTSVGFSNHHKTPLIPIGAMWLGAQFVEVHVTLDRTMVGSDHAASLERQGLELLVREKNRIEKAMGNGLITLYSSEKAARKKLRGE